jgi:hypothetical protein
LLIFVKLCGVGQLLVQVGLTWLDRWAKTLSGKDQAPFLCHQICGALLTAEQTGGEAGGQARQALVAASRGYQGPLLACCVVWCVWSVHSYASAAKVLATRRYCNKVLLTFQPERLHEFWLL